MNRFLELVEESNPEKDIDALTDAKRSLQRLLIKSKIETHGKAFEDILSVRLDDGRVVELEVKDVQHPVEDDEGNIKDSVESITAIANLPDQGVMGQLTSSTARKLQMAKRKMSKAALNIAKKMEQASR